MKILICSSYYWPEPAGTAPFVTGMAEYLQESGHDVTVATAFAHYPQWSAGDIATLGRTEVRRGVRVRRRALYVPPRQSAAHRALYEASMYALGTTALIDRRRPDVIIGFIPSLAAASLAATAALLFRRPYGLVIHDLMGPGASQSGMQGGSAVGSLVARVETSLARGATHVAIIAEGFRSYFEAHGVGADRLHRVRTWMQRTEPVESPEETRVRMGWSIDDFVCVHAGNMGHKQGLDNLLEAAGLIDDVAIRIVLLGDGNERRRLEDKARAMSLTNLSFAEPEPEGRYEAVLNSADVLVVNQRATVGDMSLPSKLTAYFPAGRPVIAAVSADSETAREMGDADAGMIVAPDDPRHLADSIRWMKAHPFDRQRMGESARRYANRVLDRNRILSEYERFIEIVACS